MSSVDGSSQIAKDCDALAILHRNKVGGLSTEQFQSMGFVEEEASFSNEMLVKIALTRYSAGGITTLMYDGARSTVHEIGKVHKAKLIAEANQEVGHDAQWAKLQGKPTGEIDPKDASVDG